MKELNLAYEEINLHHDIIENMLTIQDRYANYREKATACHKLASYSKISSSLAASMEQLDLSPLTLDVQSAYTLSTEGFWQSVKNFFKAIGHYFKRLFLAIFAKDYAYDKVKKLNGKLDNLADTLKKAIDVKQDIINVFEGVDEVIKADKELSKLTKVEEIVNANNANGKLMEIAKLKYKMCKESFIDVLLSCRYNLVFHRVPSEFTSDVISSLDYNVKLLTIIKNYITSPVNNIEEEHNKFKTEMDKTLDEISSNHKLTKEILNFIIKEAALEGEIKTENIHGYILNGNKLGLVLSDANENHDMVFNKNVELKSSELKSVTEDFLITSNTNDIKLLKLQLDMHIKHLKKSLDNLEKKHKTQFETFGSMVKEIITGIDKYGNNIIEKAGAKDNESTNELRESINNLKGMMNLITKVTVPYFSSSRDAVVNALEKHINYLMELVKIYGITDENLDKLDENLDKAKELDKEAADKRKEIDIERGKQDE